MTREEAILEGRRKLQAGDFQRAVVKQAPDDLEWDRLTLECGHTKAWSPRMMIPDDKNKSMRERCAACAEEWIAKNSDEVA